MDISSSALTDKQKARALSVKRIMEGVPIKVDPVSNQVEIVFKRRVEAVMKDVITNRSKTTSPKRKSRSTTR
jgi:hypothetical protein